MEAGRRVADSEQYFISRAGAEAQFAGTIARILQGAGSTVLLQQDDVRGRNFGDWMHLALAGPARVVVLLSAAYLASENCRAELTNALAGDWLNSRRRVIVLRADHCEPVGLLAAIEHWDLVDVRDDPVLLQEAVLAAVRDAGRVPADDKVSAYWRPPCSIVDERAVRTVASFTGREAELAALREALHDDRAVAVVHGLGGTGKSALAREYASRERARYGTVWSVTASSDEAVVDSILRLAARPRTDVDRRTAAREILAALPRSTKEPALLIFDDLAGEELLRAWEPPPGMRVLATSRNAAWSNNVHRVMLAVWNAEDGVRYLCTESGRAHDNAAAYALVDALGGLPLALSHAAAYLKRTVTVSARTYLERIAVLLAEAPPDAEYGRAVFATFTEAIATAERETPGSAAVMCLASFFAPARIPADLFLESIAPPQTLRPSAPETRAVPQPISWADVLSVLGDARIVDEAIGTLHRLSLATFTESDRTFEIHRLVQAAARTLIIDSELAWANTAVGALIAAFRDAGPSSWKRCDELLPHVRTALAAVPADAIFPLVGLLATLCGEFLLQRASFSEAETLLRRALTIADAMQGPRSGAWFLMRDLAAVLMWTGRTHEADEFLGKALAAAEAGFGANSPQVADTLTASANILRESERAEEAESFARRATGLRELIMGPDDPGVAPSLNTLGYVLRDRGRLDEAEALYRRALAIETEAYGERDPRVGVTTNNLAQMLLTAGRLDESERLQRRALEIHEAAYGSQHFEVATDLDNLGTVLYRQGRLEEAEMHARRALAIDEAVSGPLHPRNAVHLTILADILRDTGLTSEADDCYRRALAINDSAYGPLNARPAAVMDRYSRLLVQSERFDELDALQRRALAIVEAQYGPNHPAVGSRVSTLAYIADARHRFDEGTALYARTVAIYENAASEHPSELDIPALNELAIALKNAGRVEEAQALQRRTVARARAHAPKSDLLRMALLELASILRAAKQFAEADALCREAIGIARRLHGSDDPRYAADLNARGELLAEMRRYADAERITRQSLAIFEHSGAEDDAKQLVVLGNLGTLLAWSGRHDEGETVLRRTLDAAERRFGAAHGHLVTVLFNLGDLLIVTGRTGEADALYEHAVEVAERAYGGDHPALASALERLAASRRAVSRLDEAERYVRRALAMHERRRRFANVVHALIELARTLVASGRRAEAEASFARALDTADRMAAASAGDESHRRETAIALVEHAEILLANERYDTCEPLLRRALELTSTMDGLSYEDRCVPRDHLATLLRATSRIGEAEALRRTALDEDERRYGARSTEAAMAMVTLAQVLIATERYGDAERHLRRALGIVERRKGRESEETAVVLMGLVRALIGTGGRDLEAVVRRAIAAMESCYGPDDEHLVALLERLGITLANAGRGAEAEAAYRRALDITERTRGPDHPDAGMALSRLGLLLMGRGAFEEARAVYGRAIGIDDANGNAPPHKMSTDRMHLGAAAFRTGRLEEAEAAYRGGLAIAETHDDARSLAPQLAAYLADTVRNAGRLEEAETLFRRAIPELEAAYGPRHSEVAIALHNFALVLMAEERYAAAETIWRRIEAMGSAKPGGTFSVTPSALACLAEVLRRTGRHNEAVVLLNRVVAMLRDRGDDVSRGAALTNIAKLFDEMQRSLEAEAAYRGAVAAYERAYGTGDLNVTSPLVDLANFLHGAKRFADAEVILRRVAMLSERHFGPDHLNVVPSLNNLALLLRECGREAEAEPFARRAAAIWSAHHPS